MASHSIKNILAFVDQIQSQIDLPAIRTASRTSRSWQSFSKDLSEQIQAAAADIDTALHVGKISAGDLAIRSRRAYQWLSFLANPESLDAHLDALQRVNLYLPGIHIASRKRKDLQISFYHQGALYQVRDLGKSLDMRIQEGFISAPDMILTGLLEAAFNPEAKAVRREIKAYTFSSAYQEIRGRLEYLGVPRDSFAAGSVHDLRDSFHRVNQAYFSGKLDKPHLVWSNRLTHRKFGHYQWDTDTVMLSRSLDHPGIPDLAVDYVMYHELLHKKLGAKYVQHNRIAHTGDFRKAESRFRDLAQAKRILNRIARTRVRRR